MSQYVVLLSWDKEASVWIVSSDDIPGLVLESGSLDALIERVRFAAPELLALNGINGRTDIKKPRHCEAPKALKQSRNILDRHGASRLAMTVVCQ